MTYGTTGLCKVGLGGVCQYAICSPAHIGSINLCTLFTFCFENYKHETLFVISCQQLPFWKTAKLDRFHSNSKVLGRKTMGFFQSHKFYSFVRDTLKSPFIVYVMTLCLPQKNVVMRILSIRNAFLKLLGRVVYLHTLSLLFKLLSRKKNSGTLQILISCEVLTAQRADDVLHICYARILFSDQFNHFSFCL